MDDKQKKIIKDFFNGDNIDAVLVFGSQASGKVKPTSDIDVAVLYSDQNVPSAEEVLGIKDKLASSLKQSVDLIVLNRANTILTHQILKKNIAILNNNPAHLNTLFVRHVTAYADLKRSRRVIEENLHKRKLYG